MYILKHHTCASTSTWSEGLIIGKAFFLCPCSDCTHNCTFKMLVVLLRVRIWVRVRRRTITWECSIHLIFRCVKPVTPLMLRSIFCSSWHFYLSQPIVPGFFGVTEVSSFLISYHLYTFLRTWYNLYTMLRTQYNLYTILRMIPPCSKYFSSLCIY